MIFNDIMHLAFYTNRMDEMIDFYERKLGGEIKSVVRYKEYADRSDRPAMQEIAIKDPEKVFYVYIEVCPGQFIELFPATPEMVTYKNELGKQTGYSHFALTCDDIFETRKKLESSGVVFDTEISKGPSETYQMWTHDPDGNMFEIMQYTPNSWQVVGRK